MARISEEGGKAEVTVKMRPAQPIDRAVAGGQCSAAAIADQGVIRDPLAHFWSLRRLGTALNAQR
jgi:hypothetical protein